MNDVRIVVDALAAELLKIQITPWLANALAFIKKTVQSTISFINSRPTLLREGIRLLIFLGCLGAIVSLVVAIRRNWNSRLRDEKHDLCYGYFSGTRTNIVRLTRAEYFDLLFSNLWNKSCVYYWVHCFGELTLRSRIIGILAAAPYLAFGVIAVIEFIIKIVAGLALAIALIPAELILYIAAKIIVLIIRPIASAVSTAQLKTQRCLDCYAEFKKPIMKCPNCGVDHEYISPGQYGLFFARCTCGRLLKIMPRHQQNYSFKCPDCYEPIAANRNRQTFIGVVAGVGAWESTFGHDLRKAIDAAAAREGTMVSVMGSPRMISLTDPVYPEPNSDPHDAESVALCCKRRFEHLTTSLVLHAFPTQRILDDNFAKSPLLMGQLDGIVFIIDVTKKPRSSSIEDQPEREMECIISLFIQKFHTMKGTKPNRLSSVRVSIAVVDDGLPAGASRGNGDQAYCEQLLFKHGYGHAVAQLRSAFKNIMFFVADKNAPDGVFGPEIQSEMIAWLTKGSRDAASEMLAKRRAV